MLLASNPLKTKLFENFVLFALWNNKFLSKLSIYSSWILIFLPGAAVFVSKPYAIVMTKPKKSIAIIVTGSLRHTWNSK